MAIWTCERCGEEFKRDRSGTRVIRFCSQKCYHEWNRESGSNFGQFQKGKAPWNKGTKGAVKANSGTFRPGHQMGRLDVGTTTIRTDKCGHKRAWIKVTDNQNPADWKMRAVVVWEEEYGPVQDGYILHHCDRDTLNDVLSNLDPMSRAEHLAEHRLKYEKRRKRAATKATRARHARNRAAKKESTETPTEVL